MLTTTLKPKRCKARACGREFAPSRPMQAVCSPLCGLTLARAKREQDEAEKRRQERARDRERRERAKTRSQWAREAQAAVNAWVRLRDEGRPCISCGRMHEGQWHAGHYLSRGARPELALHPDNVARQCAPCNLHLHGNQAAFRVGLIERIGLERVLALEGPHTPAKHTADDYRRIRDEYRAKTKAIKDQLKERE